MFGLHLVKLALAVVLAGGVERVDPSGTRWGSSGQLRAAHWDDIRAHGKLAKRGVFVFR